MEKKIFYTLQQQKGVKGVRKECGYELEIANHAKNAGAVPVLCTSKKIENNSDAVLSRASEVDKIVFIGKDELMEQNDFNNQIEQLMLI